MTLEMIRQPRTDSGLAAREKEEKPWKSEEFRSIWSSLFLCLSLPESNGTGFTPDTALAPRRPTPCFSFCSETVTETQTETEGEGKYKKHA